MFFKMTKRLHILAFILTGVVLLSGCSQNKAAEGQKQESGTAQTKQLTVVTSFYPMYISTINITKGVEGVNVINMTKPQTGCLHDYQLTPEDLKTLEKADLFVVNGAGMEAFLDKAVKQQAKMKIIEASKNIELLKDENDEENPHVWVSITNNIVQVKNIAEQLSVADPAHAVQYQNNAVEYTNKLEALRSEMHKALDNMPNKQIITFHEAFPYFAKEFNLNIVDVIEREPGTEPSPKELEETIAKIKAANIRALFAEPQYPSKAAQTIARETSATVFSLDPVVTGETNPEAYDAYLTAMKENMKILKEALQ